MYSCGAESCANLDRGCCVLYIVSAPERTASGRQSSDKSGSSRRPTEDEIGPCPSWPSQSRRVGTRWTYARGLATARLRGGQRPTAVDASTCLRGTMPLQSTGKLCIAQHRLTYPSAQQQRRPPATSICGLYIVRNYT